MFFKENKQMNQAQSKLKFVYLIIKTTNMSVLAAVKN